MINGATHPRETLLLTRAYGPQPCALHPIVTQPYLWATVTVLCSVPLTSRPQHQSGQGSTTALPAGIRRQHKTSPARVPHLGGGYLLLAWHGLTNREASL